MGMPVGEGDYDGFAEDELVVNGTRADYDLSGLRHAIDTIRRTTFRWTVTSHPKGDGTIDYRLQVGALNAVQVYPDAKVLADERLLEDGVARDTIHIDGGNICRDADNSVVARVDFTSQSALDPNGK